MRTAARPRWLTALVVSVLAGGAVALVAALAGSEAALLQALTRQVPAATAGILAAPPLTALLSIAAGLLAGRHPGWADRRRGALVLTGCSVCLVWLGLVSWVWVAVEGQFSAPLTTGPAGRAGMSALATLLLPAIAAVFAAAVVIAARVSAATRTVAGEGYVLATHSRGLPTTVLIIRRMLRRSYTTIQVVLVLEFLVLYVESLAVQAVFTTPALAALVPVVPAESLPVVLASAALCMAGLVVAGITLASRGLALAPPRFRRAAAPGQPAIGTTTQPRHDAAPTLPSKSFRAADFLDIRDLRLHPPAEPGEPLAGISLTVPRGQALAVVGGDGASLLCLAIAGLLPPGTAISSGSILFEGSELVGVHHRQYRYLRRHRIGFLAAPGIHRLDPDIRVGQQLTRPATRRRGGTSTQRTEALELLTGVGLPDAAAVLVAYPRELAIATEQRVLLARALAGGPHLLIADNPTRGLTAAEEASFLDVLRALQQELGFTLIVASARVDNVARCDRVAVMSAGTIVEHASAHDLLTAPQHPHSRHLLATGRSDPDQIGRGPEV